MTKILLSLAAASTLMLAGGDITPVEPAVFTEAVETEAQGWSFDGQGVLYYQTRAEDDLFAKENSKSNIGLQLKAANDNIAYGIGAGVELTGLGSINPNIGITSTGMQSADGDLNGGAVTQAYLTYTLGDTVATAGRIELDRTLSPFAYSEDWNVFSNTFDAATLVNTSIPDTTLVGAYIRSANSHDNLSEFTRINEDGMFMLTAQNKTIPGLGITGSWYYIGDAANLGNTNILWGDAQFGYAGFDIGVQGGKTLVDNGNDTLAYGAKIGNDFGPLDVSFAYSNVDDGSTGVRNVIDPVASDSILYTAMLMNPEVIASDNQTYKAQVGADVLAGNLYVAYGYTDGVNEFHETDVVYTAELDNGLSVLGGYVYTDTQDTTDHAIRAWARYNF